MKKSNHNQFSNTLPDRSKSPNVQDSHDWQHHSRCTSKTIPTPWHRAYRKEDNGFGRVTVDRIEVQVSDHKFWTRFVDSWEPQTEKIYRQFVRPGGLVLDIGAWIGPTVVYALACQASAVVALEPNPDSFSALSQISKQVSQYGCFVTTLNLAIGDQDEEVSMGLPNGVVDTSQSGWTGQDFTVQSTTLSTLIESQNINNPDLVKIDIEGSEARIGKSLSSLAPQCQVVHLSIHVPCFPPDSDIDALIQAAAAYEVFDDRGQRLGHREFAERVSSTERYPVWGTKHGNFFEVLMLSRQA